MKAKCKICGESFLLPQDTVEMIEEGFLSISDIDICDECAEDMNLPLEPDEYSDADPGL